jgi:hypothetical protein
MLTTTRAPGRIKLRLSYPCRSACGIVFLVFPLWTLPAQTLQLSSAAASQGASVAIEVSLESSKGKEPLALQWETAIPSTQLSLIDNALLAGPAARASGKSVTCAVKAESRGTTTFVCVLAGGQEPIQNGVIAALRLGISPDARIGPARIRIANALAVSRAQKELPINATETVVSIRTK